MSLKILSKTTHFLSSHEKNGAIHENASNTHYKNFGWVRKIAAWPKIK
jgi:hypothetical protein